MLQDKRQPGCKLIHERLFDNLQQTEVSQKDMHDFMQRCIEDNNRGLTRIDVDLVLTWAYKEREPQSPAPVIFEYFGKLASRGMINSPLLVGRRVKLLY